MVYNTTLFPATTTECPKLTKEPPKNWNALLLHPSTEFKPHFVSTMWGYYLTVGYYVGIVPFKPVLDRENMCWRLHAHKLQQVICFLCVWLLYWFSWITEKIADVVNKIRERDDGNELSLSASSYFHVLNGILSFTCTGLFFTKLVRYQDVIMDHMNYTLTFHLEGVSSSKRRTVGCYLFLAAVVSIVTICPLITHFYNPTNGKILFSGESFVDYIEGGRHRFLLEDTSNNTVHSPENKVMGCVEYIMVFAFMHVEWFQQCLFLGPIPLSFWVMAKEFQQFLGVLEEESAKTGRKLERFQESYEAWKACTSSLNNVWSVSTLFFIVDSDVYAMLILNLNVRSGNFIQILDMITWMLFVAAFFVLSGETYRMLEGFKGVLLRQENWDHFHKHNRGTLVRLVRDLDGGPIVGLGKTGLYKVTYGFIAQLLIATTTLFLVSFEN